MRFLMVLGVCAAGLTVSPAAQADRESGLAPDGVAPTRPKRPTRTKKNAYWVTTSGVAEHGREETAKSALVRAKDAARLKAVKKVVGVHVKSNFYHYQATLGHKNHEVIQDVTSQLAQGTVLDERVVSSACRPLDAKGKRHRCEVRLECQVMDRRARKDPGYKVSIKANKRNFVHGDRAMVVARVTRPSFLYVFCFSGDEITLLFPNRFRKSNLVRANARFVFPDRAEKKRGIMLKTMLPAGKKEIGESLKVFAFKHDPRFFSDAQMASQAFMTFKGSASGLYRTLVKKLIAIEPSDFAESSFAYFIRQN